MIKLADQGSHPRVYAGAVRRLGFTFHNGSIGDSRHALPELEGDRSNCWRLFVKFAAVSCWAIWPAQSMHGHPIPEPEGPSPCQRCKQ